MTRTDPARLPAGAEVPVALTISSTVTLRGGVELPLLGLGVYQSRPGAETRLAVEAALRLGYRHVDTARAYGNERDVAAGIAASGVPREAVFITTKLWNTDHGYDETLRACDLSLARLGTERVDLYLVHWPVQGVRDDTWRAMERLRADGKARAIGVSNYTVRHLEELLGQAKEPPAVNQVELHPFLQQPALLGFCREHGIVVEAYAPLVKAQRMDHPVLRRLAKKHGATPAQILVRWALQLGVVVLPKSVRRERIEENADVYRFALDGADLAELSKLDEGYRTSWDPTDAP
jgi:diketogulonate reductase-like aldo/keto reductase